MLIQFKEGMFNEYQAMAKAFYTTPAVASAIDDAILLANFNRVLNDSNVLGALVEMNNEVVGYCLVSMMYSTEIGADCAWVEELYIKPDYQGKGYGTQALESVLAYLRREGISRVRLEVTPRNRGAIRLYESLGFVMSPYQVLNYNG